MSTPPRLRHLAAFKTPKGRRRGVQFDPFSPHGLKHLEALTLTGSTVRCARFHPKAFKALNAAERLRQLHERLSVCSRELRMRQRHMVLRAIDAHEYSSNKAFVRGLRENLLHLYDSTIRQVERPPSSAGNRARRRRIAHAAAPHRAFYDHVISELEQFRSVISAVTPTPHRGRILFP